MAARIIGAQKVSVTTTAADVDICYRAFMIENLSADKAVYIKEKEGTACTADNGFCIPAGKVLDKVLTAEKLSIVGSGSADVRILYLDEER